MGCHDIGGSEAIFSGALQTGLGNGSWLDGAVKIAYVELGFQVPRSDLGQSEQSCRGAGFNADVNASGVMS